MSLCVSVCLCMSLVISLCCVSVCLCLHLCIFMRLRVYPCVSVCVCVCVSVWPDSNHSAVTFARAGAHACGQQYRVFSLFETATHDKELACPRRGKRNARKRESWCVSEKPLHNHLGRQRVDERKWQVQFAELGKQFGAA